MNRINSFGFLLGLTSLFMIDNHDVRALEGESIIGGENTKVGEYTYQASIQVYGQNICGGSILDDYHIITAAHCVIDRNDKFTGYPLKVLAGVNDLKSKASTRVLVDVEKIYVTRKFSNNDKERSSGDIAVLKLKGPLGIGSNPNLSKIRLPEKKSYVNEKAIVTGFGWNQIDLGVHPLTYALEEISGRSYGKMRFAEAKVRSNEECQKNYRLPITNGHICAQLVQRVFFNHEGVCSGDSGGPLVYNGNVLIGVVSTSPIGCKENRVAAVYTRVSHYLDFIKKVVNGERDPEIRSTTLRIRY